jgi:hypothetical protein
MPKAGAKVGRDVTLGTLRDWFCDTRCAGAGERTGDTRTVRIAIVSDTLDDYVSTMLKQSPQPTQFYLRVGLGVPGAALESR